MGMYDQVRVRGPVWVCSESHALTELQTQNLGETLGDWTTATQIEMNLREGFEGPMS